MADNKNDSDGMGCVLSLVIVGFFWLLVYVLDANRRIQVIEEHVGIHTEGQP